MPYPRATLFWTVTMFFLFCCLLISATPCSALSDSEVDALYPLTAGMTTGERIAFWAGRFVGTPYDTVPVGIYVARGVIVSDEAVDCMYLTFRSVELALSGSSAEARRVALVMRFRSTQGKVDGERVNYDGRFRYGEDMIRSGQWGRDITAGIGDTFNSAVPEGDRELPAISPRTLSEKQDQLRSGDIVFLVKHPKGRVRGEIVGHIGIIKREAGAVYLIHAQGMKRKGGSVRKSPLQEYLRTMPFSGAVLTRFD